jgi:hypothetical protein
MPQQQERRITVPDDGHVPSALRRWLSDMMDLFSGGVAVLSVQRPTRSNDQNAYYWGVVLPAVRDGFHKAGIDTLHMTGPSGDQIDMPVSVNLLHRWYKNKYLVPEEPGEEPTTTNLSTTQMHEYIEAIRNDREVRRLEIHVPQAGRPHPAHD